jgi:hypothetical protein
MVLARVRAVIRHLERDGRGTARHDDAAAEVAEVAVASTAPESATRPKRAGDAFWTALRQIDLTQSSESDEPGESAANDGADVRDHNAMSPRR